jgi:hypothetical protein
MLKNVSLFDYIDLETTEDCVEFLNNHYKNGKWKRKHKFKNVFFDDGEDQDTDTIRVFINESGEYATVISTPYDGTVLCLINLYDLRNIIDEIKKHAKKIYTHDYGEIYFDPFSMKVLVIGGDGGIIYSDKPQKEIEKMLESDDFDMSDFDDNISFEHIEGMSETIVEAEYSPLYDEESNDYIRVGTAVLLEYCKSLKIIIYELY